MKNPKNILEVENKLVMKRPAATNPKQAAVQCPRHIKCSDIKMQETSKQLTIYSLFLNWNEMISLQIAIPIRIWESTNKDIVCRLGKSIHEIFRSGTGLYKYFRFLVHKDGSCTSGIRYKTFPIDRLNLYFSRRKFLLARLNLGQYRETKPYSLIL